MGQVVRNNQQFETHIQADHRGQIVKQGPDSGAVDAFGRARVSEPFTLFDSVLRHSKNAELWNEIISGGTSEHLPNESSVLMTVTTSGESILRRTRKRFPYQPGKGLNILQSFAGSEPQEGLVQELGLFDDSNGVVSCVLVAPLFNLSFAVLPLATQSKLLLTKANGTLTLPHGLISQKPTSSRLILNG
jgi:hypothetical protein